MSYVDASVLWKVSVVAIVLLISLIVAALPNLQKAKPQHKIHYYFVIGGVIGPLLIAFIAAPFGIFRLFSLFGFVAFIDGIISLAVSRDILLAYTVEDIRSTDASEPLRFKDFFSSWRSILKLEKKYGVHKALAIHMLIFMGFGGLGLVIVYWLMVDLFPPFMSKFVFILPGVVGGMIGFLFNYFSIKKRLKKQQDTKFCTACGAQNAKDVRFCPKCGKQFLE